MSDKKLYIGNISYDADEDQIKALFSEFGEVESVALITDRETGRKKGFGFVEFASGDAAQQAVEGTNGKEFLGRDLKVSIARPKQSNDRRGGGGNHRGGGKRW